MIYRLDLHLHTELSPDSRITLAQAVQKAKKTHIHALAVCDHNRCAPQEVFENPLRDGVLLIPAVEYSTEVGHLLGLFLQTPCHVSGEESGRVRFDDAAVFHSRCRRQMRPRPPVRADASHCGGNNRTDRLP